VKRLIAALAARRVVAGARRRLCHRGSRCADTHAEPDPCDCSQPDSDIGGADPDSRPTSRIIHLRRLRFTRPAPVHSQPRLTGSRRNGHHPHRDRALADRCQHHHRWRHVP
jgi:hypothetical protein